MSSAPKSTALLVPGPIGNLEVLIDEPMTTEVRHVGLVCHPHPLFGGNMQNKVAHILARTFNDLNAPAVRFNFRGVGQSEGMHDDGNGEVQDVVSMLNWITQRWPGKPVWLAGFSFGAAMALRASLEHPVQRLVTVAPAIRWLAKLEGRVPACPWLIVQGDQDELVDAQAVRQWASDLPQPPTLQVLSGVDHFFHGRLSDLRERVKTWLSE